MKYFVIATCWNDEKGRAMKCIEGEFDSYMNASIFRDAYDKYYGYDKYDGTNAMIVEDLELLNNKFNCLTYRAYGEKGC